MMLYSTHTWDLVQTLEPVFPASCKTPATSTDSIRPKNHPRKNKRFRKKTKLSANRIVLSYHHLRLPISVVELSIKGIHVMQMLFYKCLKVFPVLCSSNDQIKSTLYSSVRKAMFQLHLTKYPIDPSFFLKSLKDAFIRQDCSSFDLHAQQDMVEVLEILLEELTGPSIITSAAYNIKSLSSTICNTCHQLN